MTGGSTKKSYVGRTSRVMDREMVQDYCDS